MKSDSFVVKYLSNLIPCTFKLEMGEEQTIIGRGVPEFTVTLKEPLDKKKLLTSTSLALGEEYMKGGIEVDRDLYEVLDKFLGQMGKFTTDRSALRKLLFTSTSKRNQKEEVTSHYDIGNDFYRLWLDETMSYSCGYFKTEEDTLYDAQVNKVHHILEKLHLEEGMTLLDVGCGWGFLLLEAAKMYGVKGVGITLSSEQAKEFQRRIEAEGLEERLEVRLMDYRELEKSGMEFDRVVSVGMLEHVGRENYPLFMRNVQGVLKEKGLFLLHCITAPKENPGDPWIRKYIFPGGTVPSWRELIGLMPEYGFYLLDVESLRRHYNKTLLCWKENFEGVREKVVEMMGEEFARMWELYLSSCAATFHNGVIDVDQFLVSKGVNNEISLRRVV